MKESYLALTDTLFHCLPNLIYFKDYALHSYAHLLKSLQDSRLKHLSILEEPSYDMGKDDTAEYATCALLMKDRLDKLVISDKFRVTPEEVNQEIPCYSCLYNRLHEFKRLGELTIKRRTNEEIELLEHILQSCKALNILKIELNQPRDAASSLRNSGIFADAITEFVPTKNVKVLHAEIDFSNDGKTLLYIMHKFQHLKELNLSLSSIGPAHRIDEYVLTRLLKYSTGINNFNLFNICMKHNSVAAAVGEYLDANSKPGSEHIDITYTNDVEDPNTCSLDFANRSDEYDISLSYSSRQIQSQYVDFMERNGKYVYKLGYQFCEEHFLEMQRLDIPGNCVNHAFTYCPNMRNLSFRFSIARQLNHSTMNLRKRRHLDEVSFVSCIIYPGFLERLSLVLPSVKRMRFSSAIDCAEDIYTPGNPHMEIIMSTTQIDTIIFEEHSYDNLIFLKLFVLAEEEYHYYRYNDEDDDGLRSSSEEEYANAENGRQIYVCCPNKPKLVFQHW